MKRMRLGATAALLVAGAALSGAALANDSTAALGAGGLVLTENADIRMAGEDLFISRKIVRVRYSFVNESGKTVTTRVAFPLPEIDFEAMQDSDVGWPSDDPKNPVGFKLTIDGKAVTPELEQRAFYKGEEVTGVLRRLGAPFDHRGYELGQALLKLPDSAKAELAQRGLADFFEDYAVANWTLKSTYHWKQSFPAGRPVDVAHEYKPVAGAAFINPEMYFRDPQAFYAQYGAYCLDEGTRNGLTRRLRAQQEREGETAMLMLYFVDYVLTTGKNWKGPIGAFRLTIDKGQTDNLLSLCIDGIRKTGPTTFAVERKDFEPDRDLALMFIENAQ